MQQRKIPMRKCTGCNEMKPKKELVRIVRTNEGEIKLDLTGKLNGRGAYVCKSTECLSKVRKTNALSRAFEINVSDEIYNELERSIEGIE